MLPFLVLYELCLTQLFLEEGPRSFQVPLRSWGLSDHGLQIPACSESFPDQVSRDVTRSWEALSRRPPARWLLSFSSPYPRPSVSLREQHRLHHGLCPDRATGSRETWVLGAPLVRELGLQAAARRRNKQVTGWAGPGGPRGCVLRSS